jgi:hypothetical protein
MDRRELREKILYPLTRVRAGSAGGSGVLIYSRPDPRNKGRHINCVLTCEHVVESNIKVIEEWDPLLKRDRKRDFCEEVTVEVFDYDGSTVVSSNATQADIVAYDKRHDLAVLRLHNHRPMPYVAKVIEKGAIDELDLPAPCWTCGCSLLHDPFMNPGTLTYLREIIEQKEYLMANAPSIFGNSGGGLFHGDDGSLLGLTSRITAVQLGFGVDVMTWMGFSTHPRRLYEFFDDQELQFLYDPSDDWYSAMERRSKRQKEALRELLLSRDVPTEPKLGEDQQERGKTGP